MLAGAGRPRKACSRCKGHKVRCTGEKPTCKRCLRLRHICIYGSDDGRGAPKVSTATASTDGFQSQNSLFGSTANPDGVSSQRKREYLSRIWHPAIRPWPPTQSSYVGIPMSLIITLVDVYNANVYNASLLLHKRLFLEQLAAGTACPHVVLSVCALALNFYQGPDENSVLRHHSFSTEYADQAGKLAFQDIEMPTEDHVVTFMNLALFWYSQGSWRRSAIHKGNAAQISHLLGLGSERPGIEDSFESEVRRRRFWACYLMHCHTVGFMMDVGHSPSQLTLPCREEDYDAGLPGHPRVYLSSGKTNGGIFCELVKALTFWSEASSLIKSHERSTSEILSKIYALDDRISDWWRRLPKSLALTPAGIPDVSPLILPNLLLIHILYHQCLCALHASIVPLFSWGNVEETWASARQTSAQVAYEHACAASRLIDATLSCSHALSSMPSFVAYAAYCGCAIQIPFTFSSSIAIRTRAQENVKANFKLIQGLARYWKFTALLESHVRCIYKIHAKAPTILDDEPKAVDPRKLMSFKINARHARESILGHVNILWREGHVLARSGEEVVDLSMDEEDFSTPSTRVPPAIRVQQNNLEHPVPESQSKPTSTVSQVFGQLAEQMKSQSSTPVETHQQYPAQQQLMEIESLDFFRPFHDPEMLDLFPNGQPMEFSFFQTSPASLDFCEMWPPYGDGAAESYMANVT